MKKRLLYSALFALLATTIACKSYAEPAPSKNTLPVSGRVAEPNGAGIAGVPVTDGFQWTLTDADGRYEIGFDAKRSRFISISVPAAFEVPLHEQGHPLFFRELNKKGQGDSYFTLVRRAAPMDKYTILVLGDIQLYDGDEYGSDRVSALGDEIVPDLLEFIEASPSPVIAISVGDLVGTKMMHLYPEYRKQMGRLGIPVFNLIGNHDLDPRETTAVQTIREYEDNFGPGNYSFNIGDIHYVVLDNIIFLRKQDFDPGLTDETLTWLRNDLSHVAHGSTVVLAMHVPIDSNETQKSDTKFQNYAPMMELLKDYKVHTFTGHRHTSDMYNYPAPYNIVSHVCPRTGGHHKTPGVYCTDGTPSGYMVFDVDGTSTQWYHKTVGEPDPSVQMSVFPPNKNNRIFANVWYWDSKWGAVEWWENGVKVAEMEHYPQVDPNFDEEYSAAHSGQSYTGKSWHMWRVTPSKGVRSGVVKVTDRFGTTHEQAVGW